MASASLKITRTAVAGGCVVELQGVMDETLSDAGLTDGLEGVVVFDLDGVDRITSYGVREWRRALARLEGVELYFVRCRPGLVAQFNMVRGFAGGGRLVSIYAPYRCTKCEHDLETLLDLRRRDESATLGRAPVPCTRCGANAELDDIPESYFAYVNAAPAPTPGPIAAGILDRLLGRAAPLEVIKDIEDSVTALWLRGALGHRPRLRRVADGLEGDVVVILDDVTDVTPEGIAALLPIAQAPGAEVVFARVPVSALASLARAGRGTFRIVSVSALARCERCGIDAPVELSSASATCISCGAPASLPAEPSALAASVPLADASAAVAAYLKAHRRPPESVEHETVRTAATAAPAPPLSGSRLADLQPPFRIARYEVTEVIGRGGMGTVYRGRATGAAGFERAVAVKVLHAHLLEEPHQRERFLDEARLAAKIHHANVVATIDVVSADGRPFIVMEYVPGLSLQRLRVRLDREGHRIRREAGLRIVLDVLQGLHAAHELSGPDGRHLAIVHRDVTPQNVLVGRDGVSRITDFGIASARDRVSDPTRTGQVRGTLRYISPEQVLALPVDRRADLFGAGVILWELLVGRPMIAGENEAAIMMSIVGGKRIRPQDVDPTIPAALGDTCFSALSMDPLERPATARVFQKAIEEAAAIAGVSIASAAEIAEELKQWLADPDAAPAADPPAHEYSETQPAGASGDDATGRGEEGGSGSP